VLLVMLDSAALFAMSARPTATSENATLLPVPARRAGLRERETADVGSRQSVRPFVDQRRAAGFVQPIARDQGSLARRAERRQTQTCIPDKASHGAKKGLSEGARGGCAASRLPRSAEVDRARSRALAGHLAVDILLAGGLASETINEEEWIDHEALHNTLSAHALCAALLVAACATTHSKQAGDGYGGGKQPDKNAAMEAGMPKPGPSMRASKVSSAPGTRL